MSVYEILVLGPQGPGRDALAQSFARMGHAVRTAEAGLDRAPAVPLDAGVVVLDARGAPLDWKASTVEEWAEGRPLLVLADRPAELLGELRRRSGGFALLSGPGSASGYQLALSLCAALSRVDLRPSAW
jgi:hypothetical protein